MANSSDEVQTTATRQWYLIHTKPASEAVAQTHLERQGYRVYYPRLLRSVRFRGRWVERVVSLFPRYFFLQLRVGVQTIAPVRSTVGVAGIVRFGSDYAVVPDHVIENLLRQSDPQTGLHHLSDEAVFEPGAPVCIVSGVFEGLEGVFERECGDERVIILLNILGQNIPVHVAPGVVRLSEAA